MPVFVTLQGDDIFLDALPEADRTRVHRADPRELRDRRRVHLHEPLLRRPHGRVPRLAAREDARRLSRASTSPGHGGPRPARDRRPADDRLLRPHLPGEGLPQPRRCVHSPAARRPARRPRSSRASGWLGENNRAFFDEQVAAARAAGLGARLRARRIARPRRQGAVPAVDRRAVRADRLPRAEGAVRSRSVGQRRAGRAAATRRRSRN